MLIAITGGIGMGKSTILSQFQGLGAKTLDADDVAHDMYLPNRPAYATLLQHWGNDILAQDGTLDRKRIAGIVFQSKEELAWLNSVMHPLVRNAIQDCAKEDARPLFCAIPLLFESGWEETADKIISVWCDRETQMQRLIARGWSREHAKDRLDSQWSPERKLLLADYAIVSGCSWQHLADQCRIVYQAIVASITQSL